MFSFTKGRGLYQVLRIEEGFHSDVKSDSWRAFPPKCQVVLTMGGPLWLSSFVQDKEMDQVLLVTSSRHEDRLITMNRSYKTPSRISRTYPHMNVLL